MHPYIFAFFSILLSFCQTAHAIQLRLSPEQLNESLDENSYVIVDARSLADYDAGHIPGAINFPVNLTYHHKKTNGKLVQPRQMQQRLRERGIDVNSKVVIYDDGSLVDAARLFWSLETYGLKNVKVLDHGFDDWLNRDYPVSLDSPKPTPSQYVAKIDHNRLASKFTTQLATLNANKIVIDARPEPAYRGETSVAKRFGHIPTAINIPASHNLSTVDGIAALQPLDELKKLYTDIPKENKVVIYCAIGRISSANYLALRELGYDVANYDSSWKEWGDDFKLPIEK